MTHKAKITWEKQLTERFIDNRYSRKHTWFFDGGIEVAASSSPHVVPLPLSAENAVDPEEAFVASISSCHMLWFLSLAAKTRFMVEAYEDNAEGTMDKNEQGVTAMTSVVLRPRIRFGGEKTPTSAEIDKLHHLAHENCYIARSVKTQIQIVSTHTGRGDTDV